MATLTHTKGRVVTVPDDAVDYYLTKGWTVAGGKPVPAAAPDERPTESWTNAQLDAYAEQEGIDFTGVKTKADRLAVIADSRN